MLLVSMVLLYHRGGIHSKYDVWFTIPGWCIMGIVLNYDRL